MKTNFTEAECAELGAKIARSNLRLDSEAVRSAKVVRNGRTYYVNNGVAYAAAYVQRGYWAEINQATASFEGDLNLA